MKSDDGRDFVISQGAPFFEFQRRLGLLSKQARRQGRRALLWVTIMGAAPLLLSIAFDERSHVVQLLESPGFITRFILFGLIIFTMERSVDERVKALLERFDRSGLLDETGRREGAAAIAKALRLRDSWLAEAVCLACAAGLTFVAVNAHLSGQGQAWLTYLDNGERVLTVVGWWIALISSPLFWFMLFRWLWRIAVSGALLFWIARLDMRLVATHPDKAGGIGFIGGYPNVFTPFVFAISAVVAAAVFDQLRVETMDVAAYSKLMAAWLAIVLLVFGFPLVAFSRPLRRLKNVTLREADRLATVGQRRAERKLFDRNLMPPADDAGDQALDGKDPSAFRKAADSLVTMPLSRKALAPLGAAALAPLLLAGAAQLSFGELLKAAKGLLIL